MPTPAANPPAQRLELLDLLRGLALGGMPLVHFQYYTSGGGGFATALGPIAAFMGDAYTLFAFLFGAGVGLSFLRARAQSRPPGAFAASMLRRMLGLAAIGFATETVTGYHVLNLYVLSGFALLALAACSARTLVALAAACLLAGPAATVGVGLAQRASAGVEAANDAAVARRQAYHRMLQERDQAKAHGGFPELVALQARQVLGRYADPWSYVPGEVAVLALLGLAVAKRGALPALADPAVARRWLPRAFASFVVLGAAGAAFWAHWPPVDLGFKPFSFAAGDLVGGILSTRWLGFAFATSLAWLTVVSPRARWALSPVAGAGKMAITFYVLHVFALELLLGGYWFQVPLTPLQGFLAAAATYAAMSAAAHAWLRRFRYGPVEWAWRWAAGTAPA